MLGAIFSAITGIPALIQAGTDLYETIAGKPTTATTAEQLRVDVESLPPEKQQAFADAMRQRIEEYRAETERLRNEQGDVDAATLATLPPDARVKVAISRMTTRPWTVRMFVYFLLTPAFAIWADGAMVMTQNLLLLCNALFGSNFQWSPQLLLEKFIINENYREVYVSATPWLLAAVLTYMTLRSGEKNPAAGGGITGAISGLISAIGSIKGAASKR
ncbi:hypothetical protein [Ferrovibrio terrae]|uniref:hypothetical protein n=1 Tax=Ferrovibrio terrae TaxID=2594003 RepID=UPI0031378F62